MVMDVSILHLRKHLLPKVVTVDGIEMDVKLSQPSKHLSLKATTG